MTKGTHLLRSALLALLALAVISGGSLAAGDLFDDDYKDCPYKTRLRDGQIDDLSVSRDSEEADEVNVSWTATDPTTWGLGSNAFRTSLVVILDDGNPVTKTLSLGTRSTTFDGVDTGTEVTVQMAIVVDTADGDYLISDIIGKSINQSLTKPFFSAGVRRVTAPIAGGPDGTIGTGDDDTAEEHEATGGVMYYVGYNQNFGNYKDPVGGTLGTSPNSPRLRIGLAHGAETSGERDDVDFDAYIVRITGEGGDVVPEADDIKTVTSSYTGYDRFVFGSWGAADNIDLLTNVEFSNVRINNDGAIQPAIQVGGLSVDVDGTATNIATGGAIPNTVTFAPAVGATGIHPNGLSYVRPAARVDGTTPAPAGTLFAPLPDEHRDLPQDVLDSDETYTIEAWAINEDDEVISPVASLKVRPIDEVVTFTGGLTDYFGENTAVTSVTVTEFTVLK